jgi:hypothetical protein
MYFDYLLEPLPPLYELARPDRWKFDTVSLYVNYILKASRTYLSVVTWKQAIFRYFSLVTNKTYMI